MPSSVRAVLRAAPLFALLFVAACAEPPSKEMNQAQGAIEAARAAGADQFAGDEFKAAVESLAKSDQAARDGDYRLALNYALDSRERAQNAARLAVDGKALARGDAERTIAEVTAAVTRARERLAEPEVARSPARARKEAVSAVELAETSLQEARAALGRNAYEEVKAALTGRVIAIDAALKQIEAATPPAPVRPRR